MLTTIIAIRPVPRRRSGRHSDQSFSQPKAAEATVAVIAATTTVTFVPPIEIVPGNESTKKATSAPKVISSPCAKFVRPVVPKIIERPRAAMASSSANTMPPTRSCRPCTPLLVAPALWSPIGKVTKTSASRFSVRSRETCFGLRSAVPSGSVSVSILTVNVLPRLSIEVPGSGMSKTPVSSLSAVPTSFSDSSSTEIATPGTALGVFPRWSSRQPVMWMVSSFLAGGRVQVSESAVGVLDGRRCRGGGWHGRQYGDDGCEHRHHQGGNA